ncbi:MAG: 16S rRNA (cytosine(967)-C(5))-methyltransferase RsmB [Candidatus Glassbacteria bacterium]
MHYGTGGRKSRFRVSAARREALRLLGKKGELELDTDRGLAGLEPRDRALAREIVAGTLRNRSRLDFCLSGLLREKPESLPPPVLDVLRMSAYQLLYLDRIPAYAVVSDAVELAKDSGVAGVVNGVLRNLARRSEEPEIPRSAGDPVGWLALNYSHPRWLVERYVRAWGEEFTQGLLAANNLKAPLVLRDDSADLAAGELQRRLQAEGIDCRAGRYAPEAVVIERQDLNPAELPGYPEGLFYVQDEAAILVGRLAVSPSAKRIVDFCAAPGGKITHLARLAAGPALLVACDKSRRRLARLRENVTRLALDDLFTVVAEARAPAVGPCDLVLCDVPCTGTGVIRRKPELRWRIAPSDLVSLSGLQAEIIEAAAGCVRPGGVLVYSTCSLEREENRLVVDSFLAAHPEFCLEDAARYLPAEVVTEGCLATFPNLHGTDGAFAARLVKRQP